MRRMAWLILSSLASVAFAHEDEMGTDTENIMRVSFSTQLPPEISCFIDKNREIDLTKVTPAAAKAYRIGLMAWISYFEPLQFKPALATLGYKKAELLEAVRDDEKKKKEKGIPRIHADTQAIWAEADDHIALCFRGTEATKKLDIRTDLLGLKHRIGSFGKVHTGFYGAAAAIWEQVLEKIDTMDPPKPLILCGHSLGGSLAQLASIKLMAERMGWRPRAKKDRTPYGNKKPVISDIKDLLTLDLPDPRAPLEKINELFARPIDDRSLSLAPKKKYWVAETITFGAAAVGDGKFARNAEDVMGMAANYHDPDAPNDHGYVSARIVNSADPVPVLSPRVLLGYRATNDLVLINEKKKDFPILFGKEAHRSVPKTILSFLNLKNLLNPKRLAGPHSMARYLKTMGEAMGLEMEGCYQQAIQPDPNRSVDSEAIQNYFLLPMNPKIKEP